MSRVERINTRCGVVDPGEDDLVEAVEVDDHVRVRPEREHVRKQLELLWLLVAAVREIDDYDLAAGGCGRERRGQRRGRGRIHELAGDRPADQEDDQALGRGRLEERGSEGKREAFLPAVARLADVADE